MTTMSSIFDVVGFPFRLLPPEAVFFSSLLLLPVAIYLGLPNRRSDYAPGPKSYPLIAHAFQVPLEKAWLYFEQLGKRYGPVVRLSLAGDEIVLLNKAEDAEELLIRRSQNYSSRKALVYCGKYQSTNKRTLLLPYGQDLRVHRTAFHHMLQPKVVGTYDNVLELESHDMLLSLCDGRINVESVLERYAASIVFTLTYGKRIGKDDEDLKSVLDILDGFLRECTPGAHLVDTFPILDLLPDFLAHWRVDARMKHEEEVKLYARLLLEVKDKMNNGKGAPECFAARLWENNNVANLDLETMAYLAGTVFEAGTDTTSNTLLWFIVAMILHPDVCRRAQEEIDTVMGRSGSTIPGFANMSDLPYCFALTKEVLRWRPSIPSGFPHCSDKEDFYKGYRIKAKTMVIPNIWAMHHDEEHYPNPARFSPERFISEGAIDTNPTSLSEGHYTFGFGRRICPGRFLASKSVWVAIVRILWAFDITNALDENGNPIPVDSYACTSGLTSKPKPLSARLIPRSKGHLETIQKDREKILQL